MKNWFGKLGGRAKPDPDFQELLKAGEALRKAGTDRDALTYFEQALRINPSHVPLLLRTAVTYALLKENQKCLSLARRAAEIDPANAEAWGLQEYALNTLPIPLEQNLLWLEGYLRKHPEVAQAWRLKGVVLGMLMRFDEALESSEHFVALAPKEPQAWLLKGVTLRFLGRQREALSHIAHAASMGDLKAQAELKESLDKMDRQALAELAREMGIDSEKLAKLRDGS